MVGIKLGSATSTVVDGAYARGLEVSSRLILFPDGLTRHITLRNASWAILDHFTDVEGWPPHALPEVAYLAQQETIDELGPFPSCPDFEARLRITLEKVLAQASVMDTSPTNSP